MPKTSLRANYRRSMQKTHLIFQKSDDFESWKNGNYAKAIAFGKWSLSEGLFKLF